MQWAPADAMDFHTESLGKILPKFNDKSHEQILRLLKAPGFSGHIPASEAALLAENERKTVERLMVDLLPLARTRSAPSVFNAPLEG